MQLQTRKKLQWAIALGFVFLLLAQKSTYWLSVTYLDDLKISAIALAVGMSCGYLVGVIILPLRHKRQKLVKIFCWWGIFGILCSGFVLDREIPVRTRLEIAGWIFGILTIFGLVQYLLERQKDYPKTTGPTKNEE